jgi:hypothetical protein
MKRPRPSIEIAMPCGLEPTGEGGAGELRALIGVEYFWRAVPRQRFVEHRDAKARIHRVRQAPRQNRPAGPVDNRQMSNFPRD